MPACQKAVVFGTPPPPPQPREFPAFGPAAPTQRANTAWVARTTDLANPSLRRGPPCPQAPAEAGVGGWPGTGMAVEWVSETTILHQRCGRVHPFDLPPTQRIV